MPGRIFSFLRSTSRYLRDLRRFRRLDSDQRSIVFYAETAAYWSYLGPFVEGLTRDLGRKVCYVTADENDPILTNPPDGVMSFAIGDGAICALFFATLDARLMVMSLLDLETYNIKKSKAAPVHYVYLPHNMVSTHMVFRKGAHDHFDTIFCTGPHHVRELREAEKLYGLPARNLVENGYVRLDAIHQEAAAHPPPPQGDALNILIAPSWGPEGLLETGAEDLIGNLLAAGHRVTVRPHWETTRRAADCLPTLLRDFGDNPAFRLVTEGSTNRLLFDVHLLISDWSGAAFSFAFGIERPVLFIDTPKKINNLDFDKFTSRPAEIALREELGEVLQPCDYEKAAAVAQRLCEDPQAYAVKIRMLRPQWVFNFGHSAELGARTLAELADRCKPTNI